MHYNELDYEEILRKLEPTSSIKEYFQLIRKLDIILRGKIKGNDIHAVIRILSELNEDVKKAANSNSIVNDLVGVQPMTKPIGLVYHLKYKYNEDSGKPHKYKRIKF